MQSTTTTLTIPQAAEKLGVSVGTFRKLMFEGDMPYIRVSPRRIIIPASSFDEWLERKVGEKQG